MFYVQNLCSKVLPYHYANIMEVRIHHARLEMFNALMHVVAIGEGVFISVQHFLEIKNLIHIGRE